MAALALAYPGHVCTTVMSTHLFASRAYRGPLALQQSHLTSTSLPMLAYAQRTWECAHGHYPVTLAFLQLTFELINAGVSSESVKVTQSLRYLRLTDLISKSLSQKFACIWTRQCSAVQGCSTSLGIENDPVVVPYILIIDMITHTTTELHKQPIRTCCQQDPIAVLTKAQSA